MKIYLVGGAVRDSLLGHMVHDKDWVVVGSSPEQMLEQGYQQIGKDFPVFLHPESGQEYALARTERKTTHGYQGFSCDFSPSISLEDDLMRRDLTINAMAQDEQGNIFDPYNGRADIEKRVLRHVSAAFEEDPLRVLRVARFYARYYHQGFQVADDTLALMKKIALSGELAWLTPERIWQEFSKALKEKNPEQFILLLKSCDALGIVFPEIDGLFGVPQPARWHPEIDTGIHTIMTLQQACKLSQNPLVRFAAVCHDFGKAITPANQLPSHKGHETAGKDLVKAFCKRLRAPKEFRELALIACEFHLQVHRLSELTPEQVLELYTRTDALRRPQRFLLFLQVCEADARGRKHKEHDPYPQKQRLEMLLNALQSLDIKTLIAQESEQSAIIGKIKAARLAIITHHYQ